MMNLTDELKKFAEKQIELAKKYSRTPNDVYNYRAMAYGALMFAQDIDSINDCTWWDDYWCEFQMIVDELNRKKYKENDTQSWRR